MPLKLPIIWYRFSSAPKKGKTKQNNKSDFCERLALLAADKKIINYCH